MGENDSPSILALVRDLMFSSKIMAEARASGVVVKIVRDAGQMEQFSSPAVGLLLVDLNLPGAIEAAAQWRQGGSRAVVGFVSHVDAATIARAKETGIDQVLARSRFVQILPELIRGGGAGLGQESA